MQTFVDRERHAANGARIREWRRNGAECGVGCVSGLTDGRQDHNRANEREEHSFHAPKSNRRKASEQEILSDLVDGGDIIGNENE
jgi:hypothetical protein